MKAQNHYALLLLAAFTVLFSACQKEATTTNTTSTTTPTSATLISVGAIALSSTSLTTTNLNLAKTKDSLYLINCYTKKQTIDSVAFASLPSTITTYLTTNYSGYTFTKAYKVSDSTKVITGYVVIIKYNGNYVGLKFSAAGTFGTVLEQRTAIDLLGKGWHEGGLFDNRDGKCRDTIALSAIPAAVKSYFTTNYPADTLLHASVTKDSVYVLISKNKVLYATTITAAGKFLSRVQVSTKIGKHTAVAHSALPPAILSYLTTTYPGYVFEKAYSETSGGVLQGYDVLITSNSTKYIIDFNASGTFTKSVSVR